MLLHLLLTHPLRLHHHVLRFEHTNKTRPNGLASSRGQSIKKTDEAKQLSSLSRIELVQSLYPQPQKPNFPAQSSGKGKGKGQGQRMHKERQHLNEKVVEVSVKEAETLRLQNELARTIKRQQREIIRSLIFTFVL